MAKQIGAPTTYRKPPLKRRGRHSKGKGMKTGAFGRHPR